MEEKKSEGMGNIYTAVGGALLGMGIADQLVKCIAPVIQKLQSGETLEQLKLMPGEHDKDEKPEEKEKHDNEIAELKRKLEEAEEKAKGQY